MINRTAIEVVADNISFTGERKDQGYSDPVPAVSQPPYQAVNRQQTFGETQYTGYTPDDNLPWT